jgi:16S rRNA (cytidine1402-2'-O)-methyltransferase
MKGTLYLVATPIGNLEDITLRALRVLREADIIACEDTRTTKVLLDKYEIAGKQLISYYSHNEFKRVPQLIEALEEGRSVAVVTDAGTPGISDPASAIVRAAIEKNIPVVPIPGATAAISALIASGLSTRRFAFEGFIPQKKGRKTFLESLKNEERTIIIYESPHRLVKTVQDLRTYFGERRAVVCREVTKFYEEFLRGTLTEIDELLAKKSSIKGECVIVIEGKDGAQADETEMDEQVS